MEGFLDQIRSHVQRRRRMSRLSEDIDRLLGQIEALIDDVEQEAGCRAARAIRAHIVEAVRKQDGSSAVEAARRIERRFNRRMARRQSGRDH